MFIFTAKFSKKKAIGYALALGAILCAAIFVVGRLNGANDTKTPLSISQSVTDNTSRIAYLEGLGWEIGESPIETLELMLPEALDSSYEKYNELQLAQGFDLNEYCGKHIKRYTYAVNNYPDIDAGVQANIYVCNDTVIAGDVVYSGENGFIASLEFPK